MRGTILDVGRLLHALKENRQEPDYKHRQVFVETLWIESEKEGFSRWNKSYTQREVF